MEWVLGMLPYRPHEFNVADVSLCLEVIPRFGLAMYSLSFFFFFFKVFYCNNIKTAGETLISISFPNSRKSVSSA